jgi:hypothetical protein
MAFADPQSIKIEGATTSLPRISTGGMASEYASEDGALSLKISTTNGRRKRQVVRLDQTKITDDPFNDSLNVTVGESVYLVVDRPIAGFTNAQALKAVEGFVELLSASTFSAVKKMLASES